MFWSVICFEVSYCELIQFSTSGKKPPVLRNNVWQESTTIRITELCELSCWEVVDYDDGDDEDEECYECRRMSLLSFVIYRSVCSIILS